MKKSFILVTVVALLVMLTPGCAPGGAQAPALPAPEQGATLPSGEEVNFRLLISDAPIDDFEELLVHVTDAAVQQGGESGSWEPLEGFEDVEVDLKELKDTNATEIWSGNLEPGVYSKVFIYVDNIRSDPEANIKLPSDKLQISIPFEVEDGEVTNFIYDITVIKAGQSGMYILQPQIAYSGPDQPFNDVTPKDELTIQLADCDTGEVLEGDVSPGDSVKVLVTYEGEPVEDATVNIEGMDPMTTDENGLTECFTIPDEDELEIEAESNGVEGEREIDLE